MKYKILRLLGISEPTEQVENQIDEILDITTRRLKIMIGRALIPDDLQYIAIEVSVKRFNRIGSEGTSSHSVEGESMNWSNADFDEYLDDINFWLEEHDGKSVGRGEIKFL